MLVVDFYEIDVTYLQFRILSKKKKEKEKKRRVIEHPI